MRPSVVARIVSLALCLGSVSPAFAAPAGAGPEAVQPLYWIRNDSQIIKDGKPILSDDQIGIARLDRSGRLLAYSRANSDIVVVNLATGKRAVVISRKANVTLFGTGAAETTTVYPVGFTPDGASLYFVYQAHSVFAGGNTLYTVSAGGGKPEIVEKGVQAAAVSSNGDLIIQQPGVIKVATAAGEVWEHDPSIRSLFIRGVGFSADGRPFYYSDDTLRYFDRKGTESKIDAAIGSAPVVVGDIVVSDNGRKLTCSKPGIVEGFAGLGQNRSPFK